MGKKANFEEVKEWPDQNETAFLQFLCERLNRDPNTSPSPKLDDWQEIGDQLFLSVGERYGVDKLRGKFHRLRQKYRHFLGLLEHADVTYDQNSNKIFATPEIWQMFFKKHGNYKAIKKSGCKNYELLGRVFKSAATGHKEIVHVTDVENSGKECSKGKRIADDDLSGCLDIEKEARFEMLDSCGELWAGAEPVNFVCRSTARAEKELAKNDKYKEVDKIDKRKKVADEKLRASSCAYDPYSIESCMDVLEAMDGVSDVSYAKVVEKFPNPDWRKIFMKMSTFRRNSWVTSLE